MPVAFVLRIRQLCEQRMANFDASQQASMKEAVDTLEHYAGQAYGLGTVRVSWDSDGWAGGGVGEASRCVAAAPHRLRPGYM